MGRDRALACVAYDCYRESMTDESANANEQDAIDQIARLLLEAAEESLND